MPEKTPIRVYELIGRPKMGKIWIEKTDNGRDLYYYQDEKGCWKQSYDPYGKDYEYFSQDSKIPSMMSLMNVISG